MQIAADGVTGEWKSFKIGVIQWVVSIPRLSRAYFCVSWAFLFYLRHIQPPLKQAIRSTLFSRIVSYYIERRARYSYCIVMSAHVAVFQQSICGYWRSMNTVVYTRSKTTCATCRLVA